MLHELCSPGKKKKKEAISEKSLRVFFTESECFFFLCLNNLLFCSSSSSAWAMCLYSQSTSLQTSTKPRLTERILWEWGVRSLRLMQIWWSRCGWAAAVTWPRGPSKWVASDKSANRSLDMKTTEWKPDSRTNVCLLVSRPRWDALLHSFQATSSRTLRSCWPSCWTDSMKIWTVSRRSLTWPWEMQRVVRMMYEACI